MADDRAKGYYWIKLRESLLEYPQIALYRGSTFRHERAWSLIGDDIDIDEKEIECIHETPVECPKEFLE